MNFFYIVTCPDPTAWSTWTACGRSGTRTRSRVIYSPNYLNNGCDAISVDDVQQCGKQDLHILNQKKKNKIQTVFFQSKPSPMTCTHNFYILLQQAALLAALGRSGHLATTTGAHASAPCTILTTPASVPPAPSRTSRHAVSFLAAVLLLIVICCVMRCGVLRCFFFKISCLLEQIGTHSSLQIHFLCRIMPNPIGLVSMDALLARFALVLEGELHP